MITVTVSKDEWWPMAAIDRDPNGYGTPIQATEEEIAEYERLCSRIYDLSRELLDRAKLA